MYENWKLLKTDYKEHSGEYTQVAQWCNENGYSIDDDGEYYKVVKDEPSQEDLRNSEIAELKAYLESTDYVIIKLAETTDESEKQEMLAKYDEIIIKRKEARQKINELGE